jgi:hypothetical protein
MLTRYRLPVFIAACALAGCASTVPGLSPDPADKQYKGPVAGGIAPDGRYVLSDQEAKLDCRKLSGTIHVGILQMREQAARHRPSPVAVQMQKMSAPVTGGSAYGMDPDGDAARARARLEAFNARLAEKNCPVYDLAAELKPGNTYPPAPVRPTRGR